MDVTGYSVLPTLQQLFGVCGVHILLAIFWQFLTNPQVPRLLLQSPLHVMKKWKLQMVAVQHALWHFSWLSFRHHNLVTISKRTYTPCNSTHLLPSPQFYFWSWLNNTLLCAPFPSLCFIASCPLCLSSSSLSPLFFPVSQNNKVLSPPPSFVCEIG